MAGNGDIRSGPIKVDGSYRIRRSPERSIRDGWVRIQDLTVERSFLRFKNKNDARRVHENLSRLQGGSFLKSYFIIQHRGRYWLAVDKIQYSLKKYKKEHRTIWDGSRLAPQYQDIIRGIIIGMRELHRQRYTHGRLSIKDILIVNDKPKFAFIRNEFLEGDNERRTHEDQDFEALKTLFRTVMGHGPHRRKVHKELEHFYESTEVNTALGLSKLYFHPILMTSMERFFQPVTMDTLERYPRHEKAYNARGVYYNWIEKEYRWYPYDWTKGVEVYESKKKGVEVNESKKKGSEVKEYYAEILRHAEEKGMPYGLTDWDVFKFVRNAIVHISKESKKTEEDVEKELSEMFPDYFGMAYDLFNPEEIASGSRQ
ncbi:unnamed protein product [Camellia sinensis]